MSSIIYILQKKPSGFNSNHNKTRSLHPVFASGVGLGVAVLCVWLAGGVWAWGPERGGWARGRGARRKSARPGRGGEAYNELVTFWPILRLYDTIFLVWKSVWQKHERYSWIASECSFFQGVFSWFYRSFYISMLFIENQLMTDKLCHRAPLF